MIFSMTSSTPSLETRLIGPEEPELLNQKAAARGNGDSYVAVTECYLNLLKWVKSSSCSLL